MSCQVGSCACYCHERHSGHTPPLFPRGSSCKFSAVASTKVVLHGCTTSAPQGVVRSLPCLDKCLHAQQEKSCIYPSGNFMATLIDPKKIAPFADMHTLAMFLQRIFKVIKADMQDQDSWEIQGCCVI